MTFDEWWNNLDTREQNRRIKEDAAEAFAAGKMEAAQHILDMWDSEHGITRFAVSEYVEELK